MAAQFSVSDSFVHKLRRRQRTSGSVAALPQRSGPAPFLTVAAQAQLTACLRQELDATLLEWCTWLAATGGPAVSQSTLWRAQQALDWRRKKKSVHAAERDTARVRAWRAAFVEAVQTEDVTCFKFVDEMRFKHLGPAPT